MTKLYLGRSAEFKNGIGLEFVAKMKILRGAYHGYHRRQTQTVLTAQCMLSYNSTCLSQGAAYSWMIF